MIAKAFTRITRSLRPACSLQRTRSLSRQAQPDVHAPATPIFGEPYEEEFARTFPWIDPITFGGPDKPDDVVFSEESYRKTKAFKPKDTDIIVATYQKSGTTWTQWIVYNLMMKGDLSKLDNIITAIPFLEAAPLWDGSGLIEIDSGLPCRVLKVHTSYGMSPTTGNAKYINVARYGPDVAVSWYKHQCGYKPEFTKYAYREQTFNEYIEHFINGHTPWGNYFDHVADWHKQSLIDDRILFITFEDLKADLGASCKQIADFCGLDLSIDEIEPFIHQLDFKFMKESPLINYNMLGVWPEEFEFFRKGIVGDFKNELSPEQVAVFDDKLEEAFGGEHPWTDLKERFSS